MPSRQRTTDIFFSLNLSSYNREIKIMLDAILVATGIELTGRKQRMAFDLIVMNCIHHGYANLIISHDTNHYRACRYNKSGIGIRAFKKVREKLIPIYMNYIFRANAHSQNTKRSIMEVTLAFQTIMEPYYNDMRDLIHADDELIVLNKKVGEPNQRRPVPFEYQDTSFTRKARRFVSDYNGFLAQTDIHYDIPRTLDFILSPDNNLQTAAMNEQYLNSVTGYRSGNAIYRSFNAPENFDWGDRFPNTKLGGRFYGGEWVSLKAHYIIHSGRQVNLRRFIRINGSDTVEIDFKAMNLNMLYLKEGIRPFTGHDYTQNITPDNPLSGIDRSPLKDAMLKGLNCSNYTQWKGAVCNGDHKSYLKNLRMNGLTLDSILSELIAIHPIIAHHFPLMDRVIHTPIGLKLQYDDSCIAERIMKDAMRNRIPLLPIHDSFICMVEHKEYIMQLMIRTLMDYFGYTDQEWDVSLMDQLLKVEHEEPFAL